MTIGWKAVEHYLTVALFDVQFYPACNFGKFINFGLGIPRDEKVNFAVLLESKVKSVPIVTGRAKRLISAGTYLQFL